MKMKMTTGKMTKTGKKINQYVGSVKLPTLVKESIYADNLRGL